MKRCLAVSAAVLFGMASTLPAQDSPSDTPKPVPTSRPELKIALDALKNRAARLTAAPAAGEETNRGRRGGASLPASWGGGRSGGRSRDNAPRAESTSPQQATITPAERARQIGNGATTLDFVFTTSMWWVVSRGNNCHYCLGHQDLKLRGAGVDDDAIATLDSDWSKLDPRMQAALGYARKLTLEPHLVGDADTTALKKQFSDAEIFEMTRLIGAFNSTNRWTDGLGVPQGRSFSGGETNLVTPTSEKFRITTSVVTPNTLAARPKLPTAEEFAAAMASIRKRTPRVAIPDVAESRRILADVIGDRAPYVWEQVLSADGNTSQVKTWNTVMTDDNLAPRLKAELALVCAANNRAWYSAAHAAHRLGELGASPTEVIALVVGKASGPAAAAYRLAAKSTSHPHLITDADVAAVREHYSAADTALILHVICLANMIDRVTEALGLPLEQAVAVKTSSAP